MGGVNEVREALIATGVTGIERAYEQGRVERVGGVWVVWPPKDSKGVGVTMVSADGGEVRFSPSGDWRGEEGYRLLAQSGEWLTDTGMLRVGQSRPQTAEGVTDPFEEALARFIQWRDGGGRASGEPMPAPPQFN